jgi:protein O-GlcNAc transferase
MQAGNQRSTLERATAAHQAGNLTEAERLYQAALRENGTNAEVLYRLSVLNAQRERFDAALQLVERALAVSAGIAQLHFHRAELLRALRRPEASLEAYRQALAIDPNHLEALNNLADSLTAMERMAEALPLLERALALQPDYVPALNNRANLLQLVHRTAEALQDFDRAVALSQGHPYVLFNRAGALMTLKRYTEAEADCRRALAQAPNHVGALFNLGKALAGQRKLDDALATSDTLIALQPGNPAAWCDRGSLLAGMHRHREAWACLDKALAIEPDYADAWLASGMLYSSFLQHEEALNCFRRVFALQPGNAEASCSLAEALRRLGRNEEALAAFQETLRIDKDHPFARGQVAWLKLHRCNWEGVEADIEATLRAVRDGKRAAAPLDLLTMSDGAEEQLLCARAFAAHMFPPPAATLWQGERYGNSRIRIAYLSADFRDHPVSYLIAGLLEQHDRSRFETFGLALEEQGASQLGARVKGTFEHFSLVKEMSDEQIAQWLREQQIDIAVDLMGHTTNARTGVFALHPCPVQVNYLGYAGTLGTNFHDYIIADAYVIPPGMERHYAEKVVRLPDTFQCNDSKRSAVACAPSRTKAGLPPEGVIYCSINNTAKFSPATFDLWMRVLREVPRSVLWLSAAHPIVQANLRKEAQARDIDPQRLVFAPHVKDYAEHLARLSLADVFLDTLPYNAHTTASDALWAGVPVVTRPGEALAARVAGSLLHAIGMPELITNTPEEYVALAVRLGSEPQFLSATKATLAANRATKPLFDTERFRRHIEAAYLAMWERTQRGEPPADITVAAVSSARSTRQ